MGRESWGGTDNRKTTEWQRYLKSQWNQKWKNVGGFFGLKSFTTMAGMKKVSKNKTMVLVPIANWVLDVLSPLWNHIMAFHTGVQTEPLPRGQLGKQNRADQQPTIGPALTQFLPSPSLIKNYFWLATAATVRPELMSPPVGRGWAESFSQADAQRVSLCGRINEGCQTQAKHLGREPSRDI